MSANPTWPRPCKRCDVAFERWDNYTHPGSAATHCHECYLLVIRERYQAKPKPPAAPPRPLTQASRDKLLRSIRCDLLALPAPSCGLCGEVIDPADSHGKHRAAQLDHIVPTRAGGSEFGMHNLQLAHAKCNQRAGDKGYRIWRQHPMPRVDVLGLAY